MAVFAAIDFLAKRSRFISSNSWLFAEYLAVYVLATRRYIY